MSNDGTDIKRLYLPMYQMSYTSSLIVGINACILNVPRYKYYALDSSYFTVVWTKVNMNQLILYIHLKNVHLLFLSLMIVCLNKYVFVDKLMFQVWPDSYCLMFSVIGHHLGASFLWCEALHPTPYCSCIFFTSLHTALISAGLPLKSEITESGSRAI